LLINVVILLLDAVVVAFQYAGLCSLQVFFKPVAYGLKLRMEYALLGSLIQLVASGGFVGQVPSSDQIPNTNQLPGFRGSNSSCIWQNET
jgi:predicted histidine transporter YuiF (NhaC family)